MSGMSLVFCLWSFVWDVFVLLSLVFCLGCLCSLSMEQSDENIVLINGELSLQIASIVSLNMDTLFGHIGALSVKILIFKVQICLHPQTKALGI